MTSGKVKKEVQKIEVVEAIKKYSAEQLRKVPDLRATNIRGIPGSVYKVLRIEAATQEISINQLIVNVLTKEAKRLKKKGG